MIVGGFGSRLISGRCPRGVSLEIANSVLLAVNGFLARWRNLLKFGDFIRFY